IALRYWARSQQPSSAIGAARLDAYETAYLAGGMRRAVNTAVAQLVHAGQLNMVGTHPPRFRRTDASNAKLKGFRKRVLDCFGTDCIGDLLRAAHRDGETLCAPLLEKLREAGLIVSWGNNALGVVLPHLVKLALVAFGLVKASIGITRGRPVSLLVI